MFGNHVGKTLKDNHYDVENIKKSLMEQNYENDDMFTAYSILERDILNVCYYYFHIHIFR